MVALNETTSEPGPRRAARGGVAAATYPQGGTGIPSGEMNCPGAAAHMRPAAATGFRAVDVTSGFGLSPNALNINGANTYQFVGDGPVGRVDASGQAIWFPGMPFALPQTGPGPLEAWRGPRHRLSAQDGKCRYYVNTHYSRYLGIIYTDGWKPATYGSWAQYAQGLLTGLGEYSEVAGDVGLMLSDTTFASGIYAYDGYVYYVKTRVYTYCCRYNYANARWQSTATKDVHFVFNEHGYYSMANLNPQLPGSSGALANALDALVGALSP